MKGKPDHLSTQQGNGLLIRTIKVCALLPFYGRLDPLLHRSLNTSLKNSKLMTQKRKKKSKPERGPYLDSKGRMTEILVCKKMENGGI